MTNIIVFIANGYAIMVWLVLLLVL
ncbi:hypothetical protein KL86CLO1_11114 [uncultured Eubacteriales bacterium]|uniref:Uncharacterized protein n=1 Tax=uncultured Eubacteriales bacterium TaxID=172733 RepID=A0A212JHP7_9FIRM|nr:hypothetical protein KL86CLO1_11114 [uncultured Eubacteriales bacterium]